MRASRPETVRSHREQAYGSFRVSRRLFHNVEQAHEGGKRQGLLPFGRLKQPQGKPLARHPPGTNGHLLHHAPSGVNN